MPELEPMPSSTVFLKISRSWRPGMSDSEVYEAVRGNWRIGSRRVIHYAVAVAGGIVRGVYEVDTWHPSFEEPGKKHFTGRPAPEFSGWIGESVADLVPGPAVVQYGPPDDVDPKYATTLPPLDPSSPPFDNFAGQIWVALLGNAIYELVKWRASKSFRKRRRRVEPIRMSVGEAEGWAQWNVEIANALSGDELEVTSVDVSDSGLIAEVRLSHVHKPVEYWVTLSGESGWPIVTDSGWSRTTN